jgi:phosphoribosylanthranilate isomerase
MTHIKICGIKTLADALSAIEAGADYLGFNFYPNSPRFIRTGECAEITVVLKKERPEVRLVGVFVNLPVQEINTIMGMCLLDLAQLHGDESPEFRSAVGDFAYKAFRGVPVAGVSSYARGEAPALLVDAQVKGAYGGTGATADWSAAAELAKEYPLLLAGGLKPENVAEAVRRVRPWGVDTASGVESSPGRKDAGRIKAFVQAVRVTQDQL